MNEGYYYQFGSFAAELDTSYERLMYEMRDEPDMHRTLENLLNHESARGDDEQIKNCFR